MSPRRRTAARLSVGLWALALASGVSATALRLRLADRPAPALSLVGASPEDRRAGLARMLDEAQGYYDSHPDADVARTHLPGLKNREFHGATIWTNAMGLREREIAVPKPPDTVRVLLVGDSFVFGLGAAQDQRVGVVLEQALTERAAGLKGRLEVLHVGVVSWDLIAGSEFTRRTLTPMDPDLVIQLSVRNDLDDCYGVRGFGALATFSPQVRERADALLSTEHSLRIWGLHGMMASGLGWETRSRARQRVDRVVHLREALGRRGANYLFVGAWGPNNNVVERDVAPHLAPRELAYLSHRTFIRRGYRLSQGDPHWTEEGHAYAARVLYELIRERDLLPQIELAPWDEAAEALATELRTTREEIDDFDPRADRLAVGLDFAQMTPDLGRQVLGGVDQHGRVGPYASLILRRGGPRLRLSAKALPRPEIDGATVRVFADEFELGDFELRTGETSTLGWDLPAPLMERDILSVRFETDDYCYAGENPRHCTAFRLIGVGLVH